MQTVLIDTDVAIDFLRGEPYARDFLLPLWDLSRAYLSVLTIYELYAGMKEKEKEATNDFIGACLIEPVSREIAARGGEWKAFYREKGITLTAVDCLISATALLQGHKIATRNVRHYPDKKLLLNLP
jgi:predicted nucleic acid-binding protein